MWPHEEASQPFMEGTEASFNCGELSDEVLKDDDK